MSKSTYNLFLLCLGSIFFACASCKRVSNNEIDATIFVKGFKTDIPIPNAKVTILRGKPLTGYGTQVVKELTSDADGKVLFNEQVDKAYDYFAEADKDDLYPDHRQVILTRGKKCFEATISKYVNGYVKIHLKNVAPFNNSDVIHLSTFCNGPNQIVGSNIDTSFFYCLDGLIFMGNFDKYSFSARVTKNFINSDIIIPFIPLPRDTIIVAVNY